MGDANASRNPANVELHPKECFQNDSLTIEDEERIEVVVLNMHLSYIIR